MLLKKCQRKRFNSRDSSQLIDRSIDIHIQYIYHIYIYKHMQEKRTKRDDNVENVQLSSKFSIIIIIIKLSVSLAVQVYPWEANHIHIYIVHVYIYINIVFIDRYIKIIMTNQLWTREEEQMQQRDQGWLAVSLFRSICYKLMP